MKEKYQNWAIACQLAADQGAGNINDLRSAADFLQSLAEMSKDEPDGIEFTMGDNTYVTKVNRDWHSQKRMQFAVELRQCEFQRDSYKLELAAAKARIKELEHSLLDKMTAENQAMGLYDQPKRPLMTHDQLDCILNLIGAARDFPMDARLWNDCISSATKMLVGE